MSPKKSKGIYGEQSQSIRNYSNKNLHSNTGRISKVQADLLFKKYTGLQKNKLPPSTKVHSSFQKDKKDQEKKS